MLSKKEREFVANPQSLPKHARRYLRWRIRQKLKMLAQDLEALMDGCSDELLRIKKDEITDAARPCLKGAKPFANNQTKSSANNKTSGNMQTSPGKPSENSKTEMKRFSWLEKYENW